MLPAFLLLLTACARTDGQLPDVEEESTTGLRSRLSLHPNQRLIDLLGTRYELVYPHLVRRDWGRRGLSTLNGTASHIPEATLLIETLEHKLQLDLELNEKLFPSTFVQLSYQRGMPVIGAEKLPENCYYHAKVQNEKSGKAALRTCHGIRGIILLREKIFFVHPVHGNSLDTKWPHFLFHYLPGEEKLMCGNSTVFESVGNKEEAIHSEEEAWQRNKYIELALVMDQSLFRQLKETPSVTALEIVNYVDLLYRPLNTAVSLAYLEVWMEEDLLEIGPESFSTLRRLVRYAERRIWRISGDAMHLITGAPSLPASSGAAYFDSICTSKALGLTRVVAHHFQPHVTAFVLAHMLGHNLGMEHDQEIGCKCPTGGGCTMNDGIPILGSTFFSSCSIRDYRRSLVKGHGTCLYNMPNMRRSICGNGVLEEMEKCDCGTAEECAASNPCCDPTTCTLVKHAQCSPGPCCRKCKLLSSDHQCRPSKEGGCDIPEFCDGTGEKCPDDQFQKNGAVCSGGLGYCYQGMCPILKRQCEDVWGRSSNPADTECFERLNVQGTPYGNCGNDGSGGVAKCTEENSYCGSLQCSHGEKSPVSTETLHYVVHRINSRGAMHECKSRTFPMSKLKDGLVEDGTKCGFQKLCINQTCTSLKNLMSGKCPADCSGNGVCTNANVCFCNDGWKGQDCSFVDITGQGNPEYYDMDEDNDKEETRLNPNLAVTAVAASVVVGMGLVAIIIVLVFFYRYAHNYNTCQPLKILM